MTIQASLEIIQLLERLFNNWSAWDQNRIYYLHTLLPELMLRPASGSWEDKLILDNIKRLAAPEEWNQLQAIAEDLDNQKKNILEIPDDFLDSYNFNVGLSFKKQSKQCKTPI